MNTRAYATQSATSRLSESLPQHRTIVQGYILHVQELEVFFFSLLITTERILIALAQKTQIVGVFEFLDPRWIAAKLFVEVLNRPHILRAAVTHFFFLIALDLLRCVGEHGQQSDRGQRHKQHQCDQHVAALGILRFSIRNL